MATGQACHHGAPPGALACCRSGSSNTSSWRKVLDYELWGVSPFYTPSIYRRVNPFLPQLHKFPLLHLYLNGPRKMTFACKFQFVPMLEFHQTITSCVRDCVNFATHQTTSRGTCSLAPQAISTSAETVRNCLHPCGVCLDLHLFQVVPARHGLLLSNFNRWMCLNTPHRASVPLLHQPNHIHFHSNHIHFLFSFVSLLHLNPLLHAAPSLAPRSPDLLHPHM